MPEPLPCFVPAGLRTWGWAAQLPSLHSDRSWGIGDLADLRRLARWSARLGAGALLVSPLHAPRQRLPQQSSPYSPSSRLWRNPLFIAVDEVPGFDRSLAPAPNPSGVRIDREGAWTAKMRALELLWARFPGDPAFDEFRERGGAALAAWAAFCLGDEGGTPGDASRLRFHEWLQWLLDEQLGSVAAEIRLVHDLAVGFDHDGADAWRWRDAVAGGFGIGAPPDEFNRSGQDWGLAPFDPARLEDLDGEPWRETVRANLRHAAGLRVDHVMGLFRLFWVPRGGAPPDGRYVAYPSKVLLHALAEESRAARAVVIGEDLGTVQNTVRAELSRRDVLSYRLLWFEDDEPATWPAHSLASVTTHDLPTIAGVWTGTDVAEQRALGLAVDEAAAARLRSRLGDRTGARDDAPVEEVVLRAYEVLGTAPSMFVCATLEDALAVEHRPNMPGTTDAARPNWSVPLPLSLEALEDDPRPHDLAEVLGRGR